VWVSIFNTLKKEKEKKASQEGANKLLPSLDFRNLLPHSTITCLCLAVECGNFLPISNKIRVL
jgi:hypothetical protein